MSSALMRNPWRAARAYVVRVLSMFALVSACSSGGDERSRSARDSSVDRERATETLGARLARLVAAPNGEADRDRLVSLGEVASSPTIVGRRVRVAGRCAPPLAILVPELPARGHGVWQFEADGITMLVVGTRPRACSAPQAAPLTLTAVVAEDTLAAIGDLPGTPRRYLLLVDGK